MLFLQRVLAHAGGETRCALAIDAQPLFRAPDGSIQSFVGIEYMAQCIAAHAGLLARAAGERPRVGYLVGSRRLCFHAPRFERGQRLAICAVPLWGEETGMASFACRIEDADSGALLVEGRLSCYLPRAGELAAAPGAQP
jgi:predicted hotdog family 3-hydroxylacyl-ACP dehydratase